MNISESNKIQPHNHLILKLTLKHLGWVFVYKLSGCEFEFLCCHLTFRYGTCFKQGVPWHSGKLYMITYNQWISSGENAFLKGFISYWDQPVGLQCWSVNWFSMDFWRKWFSNGLLCNWFLQYFPIHSKNNDYWNFLIKSKKSLELVSGLQHWVKNMLDIFVIQHSSIWRNFILTVLRIQKRNKHKWTFHYVAMPAMPPL